MKKVDQRGGGCSVELCSKKMNGAKNDMLPHRSHVACGTDK